MGIMEALAGTGMLIVSALTYYMNYKSSNFEKPSLDITMHVIDTDTDLGKHLVKTKNITLWGSSHLYLYIQLINTCKKVISPMMIGNDLAEKLPIFLDERDPMVLKESEDRYKFLSLTSNENLISLIKNAKKLYVEDTLKRQFFLSKEKLNILQKELENHHV